MLFDENYIKNLLPKRPQDSHKGTFGHVLNIAGSGFYSGAAYFSSMAPLKVGAGRVTLASTETVLRAVAAMTPDVILLPLDETKEKTASPCSIKTIETKINDYNAISIGCGLSVDKNTINFFEKLMKSLENSKIPVVIDADGLNILSKIHSKLQSKPDLDLQSRLGLPTQQRKTGYTLNETRDNFKLPKNTILTPHPLELSRLLGVEVETILAEPELWAKKCCEKYDCTTVLKIHKTIVAGTELQSKHPEIDVVGLSNPTYFANQGQALIATQDEKKGRVYINNTGNTALSKGGSGDVLCGMIAGFLAQGLNTFEASVLGVYLHGKTAEIASKDLTEYSVLASELLNYIHLAIKELIN